MFLKKTLRDLYVEKEIWVVPTDYVLFIHGVNVRSDDYADPLINLINSSLTPSSDYHFTPITVFWGNLTDKREKQLLNDSLQATDYRGRQIWPRLWFRQLRRSELLRFVGDVALYLSRQIGGAIADRVWDAAGPRFSQVQEGDHLHFVTHSLGTVILFDLLFGSRWDGPPSLPGYASVQFLRKAIYGISSQAPTRNPDQPSNEPPALDLNPDLHLGLKLRSVTTMGSPIGIFSLIDVDHSMEEAPNATHDITPRLQIMLDNLVRGVREELPGWKLPWSNYLHPGDPVASPLQSLLPQLVDDQEAYINVRDFLVPSNLWELLGERLPHNIIDFFTLLVGWNSISVLNSVNAHSSYWGSRKLACDVANVIMQARLS